MKRILAVSAVAMVAAMAMLGCEWSTHGDDVQSYNEYGYAWANFSGSYQRYGYENIGEEGSAVSATSTSSGSTTNQTSSGDTISSGAEVLAPSGKPVVSRPTGLTVRELVVHQKGQRLTITDNQGGKYTGTITDLRSAMGKMNYDNMKTVGGGTNAVSLATGDAVIATFSCSGTSGAQMAVTITGTFQGKVAEGQVLANRTLSGTWIEAGGRGATIYAYAPPFVNELTTSAP